MSRTTYRQNKKVKQRKSPIHGTGVFAKVVFHTGDLIGIYEGTVVTSDITTKQYPYVWWLEDGENRYWGILGDGILSRMNHSDDPNSLIATGGPYVYARKLIKVGQEITIDYGGWNDRDEDE